jgi:membrane-associated phospholipid phosphatase
MRIIYKPAFAKAAAARQTLLGAALVCALAFTTTIGRAADSLSARTRLGTIPEFHPELRLGALQGYLGVTNLPNSLTLIPPPPTPGSAAFALDVEVAQNTFALRDTPRFTLAESDFELKVPHFVKVFSCALNTQITKENAPYLYNLLSRSFTDIGLSTYAAKNHYQRTRPFQYNHEALAAAEARAFLEKDPSYPSGHSAIGWGYALILTEIAPERENEILARGRAFGESRIVCNHHWYSDVVWGQFMGAATVARLHAAPTFLADLEAAKTEFAALRAKGVPPAGDCQAETAALALGFQASSVIAIDILLEPDATMLQHCEANNARLLGVFPKGFALDATHRPHITLIQRFVRTAALDQVYAAAGKILASANVTAMKLEAFKYYYAPAGAVGVAGICAKPTPEITKLQADIIAAVAPFTLETGPVGAFTASHDDAATDAALVGYVSTFVPKMSGENFNPHVSTGVAPKAYLDQMLAEPFAPFTFSPAGAAVYQLGPFGTAAKKLKQLELKP